MSAICRMFCPKTWVLIIDWSDRKEPKENYLPTRTTSRPVHNDTQIMEFCILNLYTCMYISGLVSYSLIEVMKKIPEMYYYMNE